MRQSRKFWFCFAIGTIAMSVALALILFQAQRTKATSSSVPISGTLLPPPGPHKAGDLWIADLGGGTTMEMVWCPSGKFLMGSPVTEAGREPNETQHEVTLTQGFWLGKYEVTRRQWQAAMGALPVEYREDDIVYLHLPTRRIQVGRKNLGEDYWQLSVDCVSWEDCQEFCKKVGSGFRLPTEAEWEYACRAGSTGPFAGTGVLNDMGWFGHHSKLELQLHPGGQKKPNAWGLYDMHGNVWEWCQDWYGDYPTGAVIDPTGPAVPDAAYQRVMRSGCWHSSVCTCRSASRHCNWQGSPRSTCGFRVAYGVKAEPPVDGKQP